MLTPEQRDELERTGVLHLPDVVARADAAAIEDRVWALLAETGVRRDDPSTWRATNPRERKALKKVDAFAAFDNDVTRAFIDDLLEPGTWTYDDSGGLLLMTAPESGTWRVPHVQWHLDIPGRGDPDQPGVARLFGFVNDVEPQGGGTLVIEG